MIIYSRLNVQAHARIEENVNNGLLVPLSIGAASLKNRNKQLGSRTHSSIPFAIR
jgi:hypothetical protein